MFVKRGDCHDSMRLNSVLFFFTCLFTADFFLRQDEGPGDNAPGWRWPGGGASTEQHDPKISKKFCSPYYVASIFSVSLVVQ